MTINPFHKFQMIFHQICVMNRKFVILVLVVVVLLVAKQTTAATQPRSGCERKCGNLTIPFPFGTEPDCWLNEQFAINCDKTTNRSYMNGGNTIRVLGISLDGQMRVLSNIARACLNASGNLVSNDTTLFSLSSVGFAISSAKNRFTVVGCSTLATFQGFSIEQRFLSSCASMCPDEGPSSVVNGSCLGNGCCHSNIAERINEFSLEFEDIGINPGVENPNPCSYAFVVETARYKFLSPDLVDMQHRHTMPMVLDWAVGDSNCSVARTDLSSYACRDVNSECFHPGSTSGYTCNCSRGFEGNPYLVNGCQDIDECTTSAPCRNGYVCENLVGSYTCLCRSGFEDDGISCREIDRRGNLTRISLGVGSGFGFILLVLVIWLIYKQMKRRRRLKLKQRFFKRNGGLLIKQELSARREGHVEKTKLFTAKELDKATDHYNMSRILGHGGQGTVYKGMLDDGRIVAIKMAKKVDEGNLQQFINEVVILSQLNHRNIVKLHGCCLETEVPHLVYEYIPNGTLSHYIRQENEDFPLSWSVRLRIAREAAAALSYLHTSATVPIYHRDIKSANILLDEKYRAKLADFGTSRSIAIDQTHLTTQVLGTFGYLDPEYFQSSQFTEKSDVYSFGVVLVELLTGKKAISLKTFGEGEGHSLVSYFMFVMEEDRLVEILDAQVIEGGSKNEIEGVANLARRSLNLNGKQRPTMNEVVRQLELISISIGECDTFKPKIEEVVYPVDEADGPWEMSSTSTGNFEGSSVTSSDVQPFLHHTL